MIGHLILRLSIWFLLTANLSPANIIIGVAIAFILPRRYTEPERLKDILWAIGRILIAIPQAYKEAFEMILNPHRHENIIMERVRHGQHTGTNGGITPGLIFLDIFLITFTPKTTVLKYHKEGWYEVHEVTRRSPEL